MKTVDSIIFDLDGTLWDTCSSCAIAWNNVIARHNIQFRKIESDDVRRVTGKPHAVCIEETFKGLSRNQIDLIINETMEEDNLIISKFGGELYPDVKIGLEKLISNFPLFIVSNCQSGYIETFLDFFNFKPHFKDIECWGNTRKTKSENLALIIKRNGLQNPIYIGDADSDRIAAKDCGVPFIFVDYGFGKASPEDHVVSSFNELVNVILSGDHKFNYSNFDNKSNLVQCE